MNQHDMTRNMVLAALFAALTAIGAFLQIPTGTVPITLQFLFTALAGLLLGWKWGAVSQLLYVGIGLLGLPVFTQGGGIGYVLQPSFGFLLGLIPAAAVIGALSNTLRLELVSLAGFPPAAAAFFGALTAGLLASVYKQRSGYPRITITVPSIVIMVPGLYFYRAVYDLGTMNLSDSASWLVASLLIVISLPLGLICARILTDGSFRRCT